MLKNNKNIVINTIKSLNYEEIEWLFECCYHKINNDDDDISDIKHIIALFNEKGCNFSNNLKNKITFVNENWFVKTVFSEYKKREEEMTKIENKKNSSNEIEIDSFGYHEALDRTNIMTQMLETTLADHPVYKKHSHLNKKINNIIEELSDLYQTIGNLY